MKNILYIFLFSLLTLACTEEVDFDLNTEESRLVVEGEISTASAKHLVKLTKTTSYFNSEEAPYVTDAVLTISDGSTNWSLTEEKPGHYYTPLITPLPNKTYTLSIFSDGETYTASDYMSENLPVDSINVIEDLAFDFEENKELPFYSIFLFAQEPAGLGDGYVWKYWINKPDTAWKDMTARFLDWSYTDDEFIDGNRPDNGWEIFGYIPVKEFPPGTEVRMESYRVSLEYIDFLDAMQAQTARTGFFDGPPANIPSNVSNGAIGFFSAVAVDTSRVIVTP